MLQLPIIVFDFVLVDDTCRRHGIALALGFSLVVPQICLERVRRSRIVITPDHLDVALDFVTRDVGAIVLKFY